MKTTKQFKVILSPVGESSVAIPRVGPYLVYFNKGVGDCRFYLVGGRYAGRQVGQKTEVSFKREIKLCFSRADGIVREFKINAFGFIKVF